MRKYCRGCCFCYIVITFVHRMKLSDQYNPGNKLLYKCLYQQNFSEWVWVWCSKSFLYSCSEIELIHVNTQQFAIAIICCGKVYCIEMKTLFRKISVLGGSFGFERELTSIQWFICGFNTLLSPWHCSECFLPAYFRGISRRWQWMSLCLLKT